MKSKDKNHWAVSLSAMLAYVRCRGLISQSGFTGDLPVRSVGGTFLLPASVLALKKILHYQFCAIFAAQIRAESMLGNQDMVSEGLVSIDGNKHMVRCGT